MITIYGLKNCDSCRKAKAWLEAGDHEVSLHDLRDDGVAAADLEDWLVRLGWERLLNRRSTTWRGLPPAEKEGLDSAAAKRLMLAHPTLIKRPRHPRRRPPRCRLFRRRADGAARGPGDPLTRLGL